MSLSDKVALVTGAANGLGKAFSEILLQNGAKVAMLDMNESAGQTLKKEFDSRFGPNRSIFLLCDVQSEQQLRAAFQKSIETFDGLDIFCNNAGIFNEKDWEKTIAVNLNCVIKGTYLAVEHMNKLSGGRGGVIVNTASLAGLTPLVSAPVYTATKFGVVGFTRAMAEVSAASGYGVRINAICPPWVQTDILNLFCSDELMGNFAHLKDRTSTMIQTSRLLEPAEVARYFLQILKDEGRNGEALVTWKTGSYYATYTKYDQSGSHI
ncbi:15-hydroxyprostaglandin dehydrogenase [NAD(+)]-like [Lampris incognitus]|uniref:15-hydroxyprostaglandin dehydrogenase [NAD(+)]-like n=1 Tax=Lampris incognitus TaxID=2546036 RepID=UPI0024B5EFB7|nr:15-hydroxyprostaglandin dehydrogenase [NAD(+)]-like [Lampris incognitus]